MDASPTTPAYVICPACRERNIRGEDTCWNCMESLTDLAQPATEDSAVTIEWNRTLSTLRLRKPTKIALGSTTREALAALRTDPSGAVLVMDGDKVAGIFTERDVLNKLAGHSGIADRSVAEFMTADPVMLDVTDRMAVVLNKMGVGGFRHVPVNQDGEIIGMVAATDVMRWVLLQYFG